MNFALFADQSACVWDEPALVAALCAAGGAFAANLLQLLDLRGIPKAQWPEFNIFYWLPFFFMPLLGAGLAVVYVKSGVDLKPIVAVNIGISAPLILRAMANTAPPSVRASASGGINVPPDA